jgi:hypothetical protein
MPNPALQKGVVLNPAGRKKGVPNKLPMEAREMIMRASQEMGGWEGLVAWIRRDPRHETLWWTQIFPKLIPVTVNGLAQQNIITAIRQIIISPQGEETIRPPIFGDDSTIEDVEFNTVERH